MRDIATEAALEYKAQQISHRQLLLSHGVDAMVIRVR